MSRNLLLTLLGAALVTTGAAGLFVAMGGRSVPSVETETSSVEERITLTSWHATNCPRALETKLAQSTPRRVAECGGLDVPEAPGSLNSIQIRVIRLIPLSPTSRSPLLVLAGGPGDSFSNVVEERVDFLGRLGMERELLIVDQRGTGGGDPLLSCEDASDPDELRGCYAKLGQTADLAAFTTVQSARDLQLVLDARRLPKVAVYGVSYGTRLALEFGRAFPNSVEELILDSPVPSTVDVLGRAPENAERALRRIFQACQEQDACRSAYPSATFKDLIALSERLESEKEKQGTKFISRLVGLSLTAEVVPFIPRLVNEASEGRFELFDDLRRGFSEYEMALGLHLSVQCAEFLPQTSRGRMEEAEQQASEPFRRAFSARSYFEQCGIWRMPRAAHKDEEVVVAAPTLVVSGQFDPVTPGEYAARVAESLPRSRVISVSNASHGAALTPCGFEAVQRFLDDPETMLQEESSACPTQQHELEFALQAPSKEEKGRMLHSIRYRL